MHESSWITNHQHINLSTANRIIENLAPSLRQWFQCFCAHSMTQTHSDQVHSFWCWLAFLDLFEVGGVQQHSHWSQRTLASSIWNGEARPSQGCKSLAVPQQRNKLRTTVVNWMRGGRNRKKLLAVLESQILYHTRFYSIYDTVLSILSITF